MFKELAELLHTHFATDQSSHAQHQADGKYRRKYGAVTKLLLERILSSSGSIAIYQKNNDSTIKWICFDFDISKKNLEGANRARADVELKRVTKKFCNSLDRLEVPYLVEFSGNRGFHVWVTFSEKTSYRVGYEVQQALLEEAQLNYDRQLIGIDLFPNSGTPTDGPGLGVKVPLSKHAKSNLYALLLRSVEEVDSPPAVSSIDPNMVKTSVDILKSHRGINKLELEERLGLFISSESDETFQATRIKKIQVQNNGFELKALLKHWETHPPLKCLAEKIANGKSLNHKERKILVGMLYNVTAKKVESFGLNLLLEIFSRGSNFDRDISCRSIKKISSFNFPSQEQIENSTETNFLASLDVDSLLSACIPTFVSYEDATFEISEFDVSVAKAAELNYLFLNDEAQSRVVINELSSIDNKRLLGQVESLLKSPASSEFYKHTRNEEKKQRTLVSLKAAERIATSCILKQFVYFLDYSSSPNSHGYQANKGFKGGYIFKPWLYLWIKFVSNVSGAISDPDNSSCYIIKADIRGFYDSIPHDHLKRVLLGDSNPKIQNKLIHAPEELKSAYVSYIDFLFEHTEKITGGKKGMPQGPAYARFFAELYLDRLDQLMDQKLFQEDILLYQRYVDDIFIIASSETSAKEVLTSLRRELELLGLQLNDEKTKISEVKFYSEGFNQYRSQSKYAVDRVSRNFGDATETQKNLAINEFVKLIESDSCDEDLAFIFSHLAGVSVLDTLKSKKVQPALESKIGRGSLFKHLFNFVLEASSNWAVFDSVEGFDELQSEVLTGCLISFLESNKSVSDELVILLPKLQSKLSLTELVSENLSYLALKFGVGFDVSLIPPAQIISCLKSLHDVEDLSTETKLIDRINTELNNIKDLSSFIEAIYPLCASLGTEISDLNNLAATFYAKLANDEVAGRLAVDGNNNLISPTAASKFYYLLCLFSISNKNTSQDLLRSAWKYCAHLFNVHDVDIVLRTPDWFKKISGIEYVHENAMLLISSIVDGNIFRGLVDKAKLFEKFHGLLLVYITIQNAEIKGPDIDRAIDGLKDKAEFYRWLIDKAGTTIFPVKSKIWFEKNIVENSCIALKKDGKVLFRKPTDKFHPESRALNEHNGYSEIVVDYTAADLKTLRETISGKSTGQKLKKLIEAVDHCNALGVYPNIFCKDRLLSNDGLLPFSNEMMNCRVILVEDADDKVEVLPNSQENFIRAYFVFASGEDAGINAFRSRYIDNLDKTLDMSEFLKYLYDQVEEINGQESDFFFDLAAAAALYLTINEGDSLRRIEKFVGQYHKFNQKDAERHIYAVDNETTLDDSTPVKFLDSIWRALHLIPKEVMPYSTLFLHADVAAYKNELISLLGRQEVECAVELDEFEKIRPIVSPIAGVINFGGADYQFSDIQIVNLIAGEIHQFDIRYSVLISSAEHVYASVKKGLAYIIAIHSSLTKMYESTKARVGEFAHSGSQFKSYPAKLCDEKSISSLDGFDCAIDVVSIHRDVDRKVARSFLVKWLSSLPKKFHKPLLTLISAHEVMRKEEVAGFVSYVGDLIRDSTSNPFLIKHVGDYNGTHRILFKDNNIGRTIESLSPINIRAGAERVTIIADAIITGTQIVNSLGYYLKGGDVSPQAKLFPVNCVQAADFGNKLKALKKLEICSVLYTESARVRIEEFLRAEVNDEIQVSVVYGRDVAGNAFFGKTSRIGEQEKESIRKVLQDADCLRELCEHLNGSGLKKMRYATVADVDSANLIARYQSLPKKSFAFLSSGLRHDPTCHPLMRVLELNEKS